LHLEVCVHSDLKVLLSICSQPFKTVLMMLTLMWRRQPLLDVLNSIICQRKNSRVSIDIMIIFRNRFPWYTIQAYKRSWSTSRNQRNRSYQWDQSQQGWYRYLERSYNPSLKQNQRIQWMGPKCNSRTDHKVSSNYLRGDVRYHELTRRQIQAC
jgi:hypothetical protein